MYTRILVVVGRGWSSRTAICEAISLAQVHGAELVLVGGASRGIDSSAAEQPSIAIAAGGPHSPSGLEDHFDLAKASAMATAVAVRARSIQSEEALDADRIVKLAGRLRCDVIVVGSAGRTAIERLLNGSVIPGLISRSRVPVLVCRQRRQRNKPLMQAAMLAPFQPAGDLAPAHDRQVA